MEIRVLNTSFVLQDIVEGMDSIVWTDKYAGYGEFEIYVKYSKYFLDLFQLDYYITNSMSEHVMIVEDVRIKSDPENGDKLVVTGRSLESILDRRLVLRQVILDGSFQTGIQTLLTTQVINGTYPERNIPNFIFTATSNAVILGLSLSGQYYMDNLYEVITDICIRYGVGYKITLNASNQFVFQLYYSVDRSASQSTNPLVEFSPNFDNLLNSDYIRSRRGKKTYVFIAGEGGLINWNKSVYGPWAQVWTSDVGTGLTRRELFLDASYIPKIYNNTSIEIADEEYVTQLEQRGYEELAKNVEIYVFDGQVDLSRTYTYRVDFILGDIVQLKDDYGHSARSRINEITLSDNVNGSYIYPTLKSL
jgi:hypothetical protein